DSGRSARDRILDGAEWPRWGGAGHGVEPLGVEPLGDGHVRHPLERLRHGQPVAPARGPEEDERPADDGVHRDGGAHHVAMLAVLLARVAGVRPVVSHHPEAPLRDDDVELVLARPVGDTRTVGVKVILIQWLAVHDQAAQLVAADHAVPADPDHTLDEVLLAGVGPPFHWGLEDDNLAAVRLAKLIDELVDQNPIVDVERVLHRFRRDEEGLQHERPHQHGDEDRDAHQYRKLAPETAASFRVGLLVNHVRSVRCAHIPLAALRPVTTKVANNGTVTAEAPDRSNGCGDPIATGPGTLANVSGTPRLSHRELGQTITNARPMMFSIGTVPW